MNSRCSLLSTKRCHGKTFYNHVMWKRKGTLENIFAHDTQDDELNKTMR